MTDPETQELAELMYGGHPNAAALAKTVGDNTLPEETRRRAGLALIQLDPDTPMVPSPVALATQAVAEALVAVCYSPERKHRAMAAKAISALCGVVKAISAAERIEGRQLDQRVRELRLRELAQRERKGRAA